MALSTFYTARGSSLFKLVVCTVLAFFLLNVYFQPFPNLHLAPNLVHSDTKEPSRPTEASQSQIIEPQASRCQDIPGAEDVVVIMKTGSTEIQDKLPVHFRTTLTCYHHYLVFSDYGEEFHGVYVRDALDQVSEGIRNDNSDFELYRRLQSEGRGALAQSELSGPLSGEGGKSGKTDNPGWRLDKWKFLPMVNKTLAAYPDAKWYVFVETDTYLVWSNLLQWLAALDHTKPSYLGAQMQIGDVIFAHGGSGFIVSKPAMEMVTAEYAAHVSEWEAFTGGHWAGDCVLGKAFADANVSLTWSWPLSQGRKPSDLNYTRIDWDKRIWCSPAVFYHHLSADEVASMWNAEQNWTLNNRPFLRHQDVFQSYVMPQLGSERSGWDNMLGKIDREVTVESLEACREACRNEQGCVQYRLAMGKCALSSNVMLGEASPAGERMQSGWLVDRVADFVKGIEPCEEVLQPWIT